MELVTTAFGPMQAIPPEFAFCAMDPATHVKLSNNRNPDLAWHGLPAGTRSLALICHDRDVPSKGDDVNQEGRVIAAFLMERVGRRLALDKIAYDGALHQVAPGNVLLGLVIERAIGSGEFDEIDFLTDAEWNRRWQAETRETFEVAIYRRTPRALVPGFFADVARRSWREARP